MTITYHHRNWTFACESMVFGMSSYDCTLAEDIASYAVLGTIEYRFDKRRHESETKWIELKESEICV